MKGSSRLELLAVLCCVLLRSCIAALTNSERELKEKEKIAGRTLASIVKRSDESIFYLTGANFTKFVTERPRKYHVALFFTSNSHCPDCGPLRREYEWTARMYTEQFNHSLMSPSEMLFFFIISVEDSPELFQSLGIMHAPLLFVIGPKAVDDPKQSLSDFAVEIFKGGSLIDEIGAKFGTEIKVLYDSSTAVIALSATAALLAIVGTLAMEDIWGAAAWYQSKILWATLSTLCFAIGISGTISCIIHRSSWFHYGRNGSPSIFIEGEDRDQNYSEGFVIAGLTMICGVFGLLTYYAAKLPIYIGRDVVIIVAIAVFTVSSVYIFEYYSLKASYYRMERILPAPLWMWFTAPVKKSSGILKRLIRVISFVLTECNSWDAFFGKVKSLLVDYIARSYLKR